MRGSCTSKDNEFLQQWELLQGQKGLTKEADSRQERNNE